MWTIFNDVTSFTQQTDVDWVLESKFDETDDVYDVGYHSKHVDNITDDGKADPTKKVNDMVIDHFALSLIIQVECQSTGKTFLVLRNVKIQLYRENNHLTSNSA